MSQMITAGQAIVQMLVRNGVDTVFGLPGAQMYELFEGLFNQQNRIKLIGARHEQGIGYMAFGYARSTVRLGVYSPVPGPGMLNTTAALCTALGSCTPVLCLTGEVPRAFKGKGRGHLHELPDQIGILERLTKWARHMENFSAVGRDVNAAIEQALSGKFGPVALSMCWDTFSDKGPDELPSALKLPPPQQPDPDELEAAVRLIQSARHPMIFVGIGAQHAANEVQMLAARLQAPVVGFRGGRGILGEDQELGLSMAAARELWEDTDLIIGIGSRVEIPYMRWGGMLEYRDHIPGKQLIRMDTDPLELEKLDTAAPILADSALGTAALTRLLADEGFQASDRSDAMLQAKATAAEKIRECQPQMAYLDVIREVLPRDGFFVEELCQVGFASYFGFPVYQPRTYISSGYQGTLGFGFPTALGVKVAHPDKAVVSITGDGGFMFAVQELATAVQYNIATVTIVFNNNAYGNVMRDQQMRYNGHVIGSQLTNPDFVSLAENFGAIGMRASTPTELRPVLDKALGLNRPVVIEVPLNLSDESIPWKFIHTA